MVASVISVLLASLLIPILSPIYSFVSVSPPVVPVETLIFGCQTTFGVGAVTVTVAEPDTEVPVAVAVTVSLFVPVVSSEPTVKRPAVEMPVPDDVPPVTAHETS